jgi:hypothetical protein
MVERKNGTIAAEAASARLDRRVRAQGRRRRFSLVAIIIA